MKCGKLFHNSLIVFEETGEMFILTSEFMTEDGKFYAQALTTDEEKEAYIYFKSVSFDGEVYFYPIKDLDEYLTVLMEHCNLVSRTADLRRAPVLNRRFAFASRRKRK